MQKGGHFAALEHPELLAQEIQAFFVSLPRLRCESGLVTI
jgi:pimeloyl-ACP methyl ester carboxylesterase